MGLLDKFKKKSTAEAKAVAPKQATAKVKVEKKVEAVVDNNATETVNKVKKSDLTKKINGQAYKVLLSSVISEKAAIAESHNSYTFSVEKAATKVDVRNIIKQIYNVKVLKVRIMNREGKAKNTRGKKGRTSDWKKAIVTLAKGETVNVHEGV
ncbi:MAG TPA: 50S ribosomal protein L23 [Candidatus Magasanikbacteria bacterium]|nr:50S ribosomal protein L23 [Candidatus Magasanikbacteria bacterium]